MLRDIGRTAQEFSTAVLTTVDQDGYPFAVRCCPHPVSDIVKGTLSLGAACEGIEPGPACLTFHQHDENLWSLTSRLARGEVSGGPRAGYLFRCDRVVDGPHTRTTLSCARFLLHARRAARRYLRRRDMSRPAVPWAVMRTVWQECRPDGARRPVP